MLSVCTDYTCLLLVPIVRASPGQLVRFLWWMASVPAGINAELKPFRSIRSLVFTAWNDQARSVVSTFQVSSQVWVSTRSLTRLLNNYMERTRPIVHSALDLKAVPCISNVDMYPLFVHHCYNVVWYFHPSVQLRMRLRIQSLINFESVVRWRYSGDLFGHPC